MKVAQGFYKIIVVFAFCGLINPLYAQKKFNNLLITSRWNPLPVQPGGHIPEKSAAKFFESKPFKIIQNRGNFFNISRHHFIHENTYPPSKMGVKGPLLPVSMDHYTNTFGVFRRYEWQWEKTTRIPLRIRLGSLADCNKLEGK